jgi:hypothetical protein
MRLLGRAGQRDPTARPSLHFHDLFPFSKEVSKDHPRDSDRYPELEMDVAKRDDKMH